MKSIERTIFNNRHNLRIFSWKPSENSSPGSSLPEDSKPAWWFIFQGSKLLIKPNGTAAAIPFAQEIKALGIPPERPHYLGDLDGSACYALELAEGRPLPEGFSLEGLRQVFGGWMRNFSGSRPGPCKSWTGTAPINFAAAAAPPQFSGKPKGQKNAPSAGRSIFRAWLRR